MKHPLNAIDNAESYLELNKSELRSLVFKSNIIRGLAIAFFLVSLLVASNNLYVLGCSLFFVILSFVGTMMTIQDKASEVSLYQPLTYGGKYELEQLSEAHYQDPEVRQFLKAIKQNGREPLLAECLRLKTYLSEKDKASRSAPGIAIPA